MKYTPIRVLKAVQVRPERFKGPDGCWIVSGFRSCGVYAIVGPKGRRYIGGSLDVLYRWKRHVLGLRRGKHKNRLLLQDWSAFGEARFRFDLIEECGPVDLKFREQYWLDAFAHNSYNICPTVDLPPSSVGRKYAPEVGRKIAARVVAFQKSAAGRRRRSVLSKKLWKDPSHREFMLEVRSSYWSNPANIEAARQRAVRQHSDGRFGYRGSKLS